MTIFIYSLILAILCICIVVRFQGSLAVFSPLRPDYRRRLPGVLDPVPLTGGRNHHCIRYQHGLPPYYSGSRLGRRDQEIAHPMPLRMSSPRSYPTAQSC